MMPKQNINEAIKKEWSKQCIAMDRYIAIATVLTTVPRQENEMKNTHQSRTLKLSSVIYGTDLFSSTNASSAEDFAIPIKKKISTSNVEISRVYKNE